MGGMTGWRGRLLQAVDKDGRSDRALSLAAGLNQNFVNELRNTDKEPSVEKVLKLIAVLNVSISHVFSGVEMDGEDEELLQTFLELKPEGRQTVLGIARQLPKA